MTQDEADLVLEKMRTLYPIPNHADNREAYLAVYGRSLTHYPYSESLKAVDWLFENRPQRSWPTVTEFKDAVSRSRALTYDPAPKWLSKDEKYFRAKRYANDWLNTIDGQELQENEPLLVDWVFSWIVRENEDNGPEDIKLPTEQTYRELRIKRADWQEWFDTKATDDQRKTLLTGREQKLNRLKREGIYM